MNNQMNNEYTENNQYTENTEYEKHQDDSGGDVDRTAGIAVKLRANQDANGDIYYTGKLQHPSMLNFDKGVSIMVFVSEEGSEEMHIRSMPKHKSDKLRDQDSVLLQHYEDDRIGISLRPILDRWQNQIYIGEGFGKIKRDLSDGVFFTVFVSKEGLEEVQISPLIDHYEVDKHSGIVISLKAQTDGKGASYYTGKLQAPIDMDYSKGISFLAFTSISGEEELHIISMESHVLNRINSRSTIFRTNFGRIKILLKPHLDSYEKTFYIGEAFGDFESSVNEGLFFTIFNSIPGREEIQISKLDHKLAQKKRAEFEAKKNFQNKIKSA
jgi:hypothetical protein